MNDIALSEMQSPGTLAARPPVDYRFPKLWSILRQKPELIFFVALILVFNVPILFGEVWSSAVFQTASVSKGEWWRVFTHPFVHLTWYHLLLDGTAFLSLYWSLLERRIFVRLAYVIASAAGSLASCLASPGLLENGLCGLSGIAHALMAISAIEMLGGDKAAQKIGWISLILVVGKGIIEAITGKMFFGFLDFGLLGTPVAVSHAGGILGALIAMLLLRRVEPALISRAKSVFIAVHQWLRVRL
jgi:rhomboid family GlyGly-CTERM serine protease